MASATHGMTLGQITFNSSYFLEILNIDFGDLGKCDNIEVTNMSVAAVTTPGIGNKIFIPSIYMDAGYVSVDYNFNPDTLVFGAAGISQSCTVKLGNSSVKAQFAGTGWVYDSAMKGPLDGKVMTANAKLKWTGVVTQTAGS